MSEHAENIRKQVEFYFSDSNLPRDKFLMGKIDEDPESFVPISVLLSFKRLNALTSDAGEVADAVASSETVILSEDKTRIRRKDPVPTFDVTRTRSIVVSPVAKAAEEDALRAFFGEFGKVLSVRRIRKNKEPTETVFIEFDTEATAKAVANKEDVEYEGVKVSIVPRQSWKPQGEKKRKAPGSGDKGDKKMNPKEKTLEQIKGRVVFFNNVPEGKAREDLQEIFAKASKGEVKFIDFRRDDREGHVRFAEPEHAEAFAEALEKDEVKVDDNTIGGKMLEGDDLDVYAGHVASKRADKRRRR